MCFDRSSSVHRKKGPWGSADAPQREQTGPHKPWLHTPLTFLIPWGLRTQECGQHLSSWKFSVFGTHWQANAGVLILIQYPCGSRTMLDTPKGTARPLPQPSASLGPKTTFHPLRLAWSYPPCSPRPPGHAQKVEIAVDRVQGHACCSHTSNPHRSLQEVSLLGFLTPSL